MNGDSSVNAGDNTGDNQQPEDKEITIAETVLYEAEGVKITATGFEDGWMGPEIKLLIENNSEKNVLVTSEAVSANGYMMPLAIFSFNQLCQDRKGQN